MIVMNIIEYLQIDKNSALSSSLVFDIPLKK